VPPEQQPPLHGCVGEQVLVQAFVLVLQAWPGLPPTPAGQSVVVLQPQEPLTHWWPFGLFWQFVHEVPHDVASVFDWQVPLPVQQ
jgi:hypothetical protein